MNQHVRDTYLSMLNTESNCDPLERGKARMVIADWLEEQGYEALASMERKLGRQMVANPQFFQFGRLKI